MSTFHLVFVLNLLQQWDVCPSKSEKDKFCNQRRSHWRFGERAMGQIDLWSLKPRYSNNSKFVLYLYNCRSLVQMIFAMTDHLRVVHIGTFCPTQSRQQESIASTCLPILWLLQQPMKECSVHRKDGRFLTSPCIFFLAVSSSLVADQFALCDDQCQ